mmetsp:Transcript_31143/g.28341  ORF Transcript_31143/g.28341 Transcript_31143/m.28341 type:complete len:82 (+) Transcript_31143:429-674(+)
MKLMDWTEKLRRDWKKIAKKFDEKNITPSQCKHRFHELVPLKRGAVLKFTPEQDKLLLKSIQKYGTAWTTITSRFFPKMTP